MIVKEFSGRLFREDGMVYSNRKREWFAGYKCKDHNLVSYQVSVFYKGKYRLLQVSRIIAHLFLGLDLEDRKTLALHKKRRTEFESDNSVNNLYLGTHKDNSADMIKDGTSYFYEKFKFAEKKEKKEVRYPNGFFATNNPRKKDVSHYDTVHTPRSNFKRTCIDRGWNFEEFEEYDEKLKYRKDGYPVKIYRYKKKGEE